MEIKPGGSLRGSSPEWPKNKCPLESVGVRCTSCGSEHFSIDAGGSRRGNKVPGRCDDCSWSWGRILR